MSSSPVQAHLKKRKIVNFQVIELGTLSVIAYSVLTDLFISI